jgi:hypothetical protein
MSTVDYRNLNYGQIYQAWSSQPHIASGYQEHDLLAIHRRWRRLGKLAAAGRL